MLYKAWIGTEEAYNVPSWTKFKKLSFCFPHDKNYDNFKEKNIIDNVFINFQVKH